jgi:PhnB protein
MRNTNSLEVPAPSGHHTVTPYLLATNADKLIDFLIDVFEGQETTRIMRSDGKVSHAEVKISGSVVMIGEISEDWDPMSASIYVYVSDTDSAYRRALRAGSVSYMKPTDLPEGGDRMAAIRDPFGNVWWIVTHT